MVSMRLKTEPYAELKKLGVAFPPKGGLGEPHREITQDDFVYALACSSYSLEGVYYDQVRLAPYGKIEGRFDVHYYLWPAKVMAVTTRYLSRAVWDGKGYWLWQDDNHTGRLDFGFQVFYYRVGCLHPNLATEHLPLSMKRQTCPDCGYTNEFSTD